VERRVEPLAFARTQSAAAFNLRLSVIRFVAGFGLVGTAQTLISRGPAGHTENDVVLTLGLTTAHQGQMP
jgi:hypothetical protein